MKIQLKGKEHLSDGFVELSYTPALREWRVLRGFSEWSREPEIFRGVKKDMEKQFEGIIFDDLLDRV